MKRRLPASLLAVLLLALAFGSGCVYFRLLQIKNQLKHFDKNFLITGDPEMILGFRNPQMLPKDAAFLIGAEPLKKEDTETGRIWYYEFTMVRDGHEEPYPLDTLWLELRMSHGRLTEIIVPKEFLLYFSRRVLTETLRAAAQADILETKRIARAKVKLSPQALEELPDLPKTLELLGPPLERLYEEDREVLVYRYSLVKRTREVLISPRLYFSADGLMRRCVIRWDTSTVDAEFLRP
jgi:hypothetical protein